MFSLVNIGIISSLLIVAFVIFFAIRHYKKKNSQKLNFSYVKKDAPGAQEEYERKFLDEVKLTIQEKIELSWQFLYDITEYVLNKFSNADRTVVHQIGTKLLQNGMKYEHVVDYALKLDNNITKKKFTEQAVDSNQTQVSR